MTNTMLMQIVVIGFGGALGGVARFWLSSLINHRTGGCFPWGTLVVNTSGSLLIGSLAAVLLEMPSAHAATTLWWLLAIGVLGSYTTVSSFSLETLTLLRNDQAIQAGVNIIASVVLCLAAVFCGYALTAGLSGGWM